MTMRIYAHLRSGLVALGLVAGLSLPAAAAPLAGLDRSAVTGAASQNSTDIKAAGYRSARRCGRDGRCGRYWNGKDRRHYRHHKRYDRRSYRRSYPRYYIGPSYPRYYHAQPRRYYGRRSAHVAWCYNRYRSYRAWDNTFQPYHGPRRQCWSPYRR